jgi:pantothenate kinase
LAVAPEVPVLLIEGNYLLLDDPAWRGVRPLLDACWWVGVDDALRVARLVRRHEQFGRSAEAARAWVARSDEANAQLIQASAGRADWVVPGD